VSQKSAEVTHEPYMRRCLELAREALTAGEVPVGALLADGDRILGQGVESVRGQLDPCAHAEVRAIQEACRAAGSQRLSGLTLYSTVEPCVLCAYVVRSTGIGQVVFGIPAGRLGGCTSSYALLTDSAWPGSPPPSITRGILAAECADLMREYEGRRDRDGNGAGF
jgi:tRNA(adenine34) deaminase